MVKKGMRNSHNCCYAELIETAQGFAAVLVQGNDEGTIHIENPKARAESIIFAILGITGADLTSEEIIQEMYQVVEMLLCIKCG